MSKQRAETAAKPSSKTRKRNKYRLTVAKDKLAVLLRLPMPTIKLIDGMAKVGKSKRTTVIYGIIAGHPALAESMQTLLTANTAQ